VLDGKEELRQLAEGISSTLKDEERDDYRMVAAEFLGLLHEMGCNDETASRVARLIARLMAGLQTTPLQHASDIIDANLTSYAFVAAAAAGVFSLPDREATEGEPAEGDSSAPTGMYL
jgi:hypothetical protein